MGYAALALEIFKLIGILFVAWNTADGEQKKAMLEAGDEIHNAIKARDRSAITAGYARLRRLR